MLSYTFRLRDDMPPGFMCNESYPELPAAVEFLKQYESKAFEGCAAFEAAIKGFPAHLKKKQIKLSLDKALSAGLLLKEIKKYGVFNVITKSDGNAAGECWFGTFGHYADITAYFGAQREARIKAREAALNDPDNEWG